MHVKIVYGTMDERKVMGGKKGETALVFVETVDKIYEADKVTVHRPGNGCPPIIFTSLNGKETAIALDPMADEGEASKVYVTNEAGRTVAAYDFTAY